MFIIDGIKLFMITTYNKLGTSDLHVSQICIGTMTFGEQTNKEEAFKIALNSLNISSIINGAIPTILAAKKTKNILL